MTYEEMQILHDDLNIVEMDLSEVSGLKGLYVNGRIAINVKMSDIEKACVLAEELDTTTQPTETSSIRAIPRTESRSFVPEHGHITSRSDCSV